MKHIKKLISALLVICMIGATLYSDIGQLGTGGTVSAADEKASATLTELTFGDFQIADINHTSNASSKTWLQNGTAGSLVDTIFQGKIKYSGAGITSSSPYIILGDSGWKGIQILPEPGGTALTIKNIPGYSGSLSFNETKNGLLSFHNNEFKLSISFEGTETDDVVMKVYFNDVLGKDTAGHEAVYTLSGAKNSLLGYMSIFQGTDTAVEVTSVMPSGLTELHYEDFGYADGTYSAEKKSTYAGSLKNTVLTGKVTMDRGAYIFYGLNSWSGLQIHKQGEDQIHLNVKDGVRTDVANGATSVWTGVGNTKADLTGEFTLSISLEVLDYDNDGADDAKLGVWVNGALICGKFFILLDGFDGNHIKSELYFVANGSSNIKVASMDNKLRKLTLKDFGFASGTYESASLAEYKGTVRPTSLLNTTMTMDVTMKNGGNTWIQYATSTRSAWYGVSMQIDSSSVAIQCADVNGTSIHNNLWSYGSVFGMDSFMDDTYQLTLSMEQIDMHGDGANDDVRFGVRFNGRLYCDKYIYLENSAEVVGNGFALFQNRYGAGTATSTTLSNPAQKYDTMEELTLEDFGVTAQEYTSTNQGLLTGGTNGYRGSMDGKIFSTDVRFASYDSELFFGCRVAAKQNYWYTFKIGAVTDPDVVGNKDSAVVRATDSTGKYGDAVLDASIAGVKLTNNVYNLKISTRNVDADGDDKFDDLELGLWFNGVLYNNSFWYATDAADWFEPNLAVYCASDRGSVSLGTFEQTEAKEITYCIDKTDYFVDGDEVTVDGEFYGTSANLSTPGVYDVTYTDGNSKYMRNVLIYKTNDTTADGEVDVRDLVALKMYAANERVLDKAGKKAIGADVEFMADIAFTSVREQLLSFNKRIPAKELSKSVIGATGSGTFVVDVGSTEEGTSVMSITDVAQKESEKTNSNILTLEGCGLDYVLDFDFTKDRDIRVLQITDTQIIDSTQVRKNSVSTLSPESVKFYDPANRDQVLYNELTQLINENKPDLILLTGDITYGMFDDSGASLRDLTNQLDSYKIPWAPIFGNHEQETAIRTEGMCDIFDASAYCLFTRRHEIGGNGNYAIGIAKNGHIQRTIYMMDSNGCWSADANDLALELDGYKVANKRAMFQDDQIAWYRTVAARVNAHEGENAKIPSFMCYHYPAAEAVTAAIENGHQPMHDTSNVSYKYDLGVAVNPGDDFGFKLCSLASSGAYMKEYIYPYLLSAGTDGVFFGHEHTVDLSLSWQGIRWTYGLKTGKYESHPEETGGTLITISKDDGSFIVEHKAIANTQ